MTCSRPSGNRARLQRKAQPLGSRKLLSQVFSRSGWKCLGARFPASNFSRILGELCVSGTCFSKHAEKGPTGVYLITINRCSTLASMRLVLIVLISPPAYREARRQGCLRCQHLPHCPPSHPPEGRRDKQVSWGTGHHSISLVAGVLSSRGPVIPSTSGSPVSPVQPSVTLLGRQGCWRRGLGFPLVTSPWQHLAECFPPALQSQYKHYSAFLQLAPWKQSSQTSNIVPFFSDNLTSQIDASPPLSLSHSSFGKRKRLQGIRGMVYQKSR